MRQARADTVIEKVLYLAGVLDTFVRDTVKVRDTALVERKKLAKQD
jgi:hypothetical protein